MGRLIFTQIRMGIGSDFVNEVEKIDQLLLPICILWLSRETFRNESHDLFLAEKVYTVSADTLRLDYFAPWTG
jgi:hypothetical protein